MTNELSINRGRDALLQSFGTVGKYLSKSNVIELYINDDQYIWVELEGEGRHKTDILMSDKDVRKIIEVVAFYANTVADSRKSIISSELPFYGYRFEGSLPPITEKPTFNIRKPATRIYTLADYVADGIMTENQRQIITDAIKSKMNILLVGGTGSGKTTCTNAILEEISKTGDRVVILEDTRELQCSAKDFVVLRSNEYYDMQALLKSTLRRRPDRIVVGEVRDRTALDLIKAWNTGHPGGVCTLHANNAYEGLTRLEGLTQEAGLVVPPYSLIAGTIHYVVYIARDIVERNGELVKSRRIKEILRCTGYDAINKKYIVEYVS